MYSRASSSRTRAPRPSRKNTGVPPTAPKARTGELTPPGISSKERSKSARLVSYIVAGRGCIERGEGARGGAHVGRVEERGDHPEHVGARGDEAGGVRDGDAAAGRDGEARQPPRLREMRGARAHGRRLRGRGEHAADRDIVGAGARRGARSLGLRIAG